MIDHSILHELLEFDFDTGRMFWKKRPGERSQWNGRYAGKEAFTATALGYRQGQINGQRLQAHRVIYAAAYGEWPELIDHINQDRSDNRLSNLRSADKALNSFNSKVRSDSSTGIKGVSWSRRSNAWRAYITDAGKQVHLGFYATADDAAVARAKAFERRMEIA
jgi:hypothetical protein